jgi:hypothetical protein
MLDREGAFRKLEEMRKQVSYDEFEREITSPNGVAAAESYLSFVTDETYNDPLFAEFSAKVDLCTARDAPICLRTVSDVLGHRLFLAYCVLLGAKSFNYGMAIPASAPPAYYRLGLVQQMVDGIPYLWKQDMWKLAITDELPRHEISRTVMPYPWLWYALQDGAGLLDEKNKDLACLEAIKIHDYEEGIEVVHFMSFENRRPVEHGGFDIPYGKVYPDDFKDLRIRSNVRIILSTLSFLNSPYSEDRIGGLNRTERRRYGISNPSDSEQVRFIDLRPVSKSYREPTNEQRDVDWKCQWLVTGHHRNQWYPSLNDHRMIWVAPYIKGPEDAPLKERIYRVVR